MKKSKKIVSLLLSVLMIITALPLTAVNSFAEDTNTKTSGDYEYTVSEDGTAEITAYNGNEENVVIPSVLDGYAVTVIGERAFALNKTVKTVEIPNGVIGIRSLAFWLCENLTAVKIPETVKWIGPAVFDSCKKLKSVNLPEGLSRISEELFNHCESLENITLPKSVNDIDSCSFYGCKSLKSIVIPYGVTRIREKTFEHCEALESVIIPESVIWIETWAFSNCYSLESVTVPESVTSLSPDCFDTTNTDFAITIYGIKGSAAESYAKNYEDKCNFIAVDSTHYYGEWIVQEESTCESLGKKYRECGCGHKEYSSIDKKPHIYDDGVVTTLPTFDEEGVKTYTCMVCTETKTEPIAKLKPFPDVESGEWYCNAIAFNVAKGYFHGYGNGYFGPGNNIQRQDFVVVLSKIAGADLSAYAGQNGGFSDVPTNDYYSAAVAWAKDNHILSGYANGKFGVGDPITREQACLIFYNYCNGSVSGNVNTVLAGYPDGGNVSDWARTAVAWAAENYIVGGNGTLNPAGNANRAEMAQVIMNIPDNSTVVAKLINNATKAAVDAKVGYDWERHCTVENIDVGSATGTVNKIIHGVDSNADLNSVVGCFLGSGDKKETCPKCQTLDTIDVQKDDGTTGKLYHGSSYTLKATDIQASDIQDLTVNGDTYEFTLQDSKNPDRNGNTALSRFTNDIVVQSEVDSEIKGYISAVTVNSLKTIYKNIKVKAVITNGKLQSLEYSYAADAKIRLKAFVSITGTGNFNASTKYSNFVY